jgi:SAM-dependent methyltransferase
VSDRWLRFFAAAGREPRVTLLDALARFDVEGRQPGLAVDLGAGTGRDTAELLRRGWTVVAVDAHPEAIRRLRELAPAEGRLTTVEATFDAAEWPPADLVNASFALPFAGMAFGAAWARIRAGLRPGGRFCGQLFGPNDEWAPAADLAVHSRQEIDSLLAGWEVERLDEIEEDGQTAVGEDKHWHLFHVVARRP